MDNLRVQALAREMAFMPTALRPGVPGERSYDGDESSNAYDKSRNSIAADLLTRHLYPGAGTSANLPRAVDL